MNGIAELIDSGVLHPDEGYEILNDSEQFHIKPTTMDELPPHNPYMPIDKQDAADIAPEEDIDETEPDDYPLPPDFSPKDDMIQPGELSNLTGL